MGKITTNKIGASLVEIVATVAIVAISFTTIFSVFDFSLRQNAINQEKSININIANGVLNYLRSSNYELLNSKLYEDFNHPYLIIDELRCNDLFSEDPDNICQAVLAPTINNRKYNHEKIKIYLLPYRDEILNYWKINPAPDFPEALQKYINNIDPKIIKEDSNRNIIRIVVIVKSNINSKYDILLDGVITKEGVR